MKRAYFWFLELANYGSLGHNQNVGRSLDGKLSQEEVRLGAEGNIRNWL